MSDLPKGWVETTLGHLFEITSSKRVHQHEWTKAGVPFYRAREIKRLAREGSVENELFISEELFQRYAAEFGAPAVGDLMVTAVGTLGECYRVRKGDRFYFKDASVLWLRSEGSANTEFVAKAFSSKDVREQVHQGGGTTVGTYTIGSAKGTVISLPPLAEQKRIVAKLDALNTKSARARTELARIETLVFRYKQALLSKAFSGELTQGWRLGAHQSDIGAVLKSVRASRQNSPKLARRKAVSEVPQALLPDTWRWISPDELAADASYSIGIGPFGSNLVKADYRARGVRLVFVRDIRREEFSSENAVFVDDAKAAELHQHWVAGGDLLITKMGDPPGDTAIFPLEQPAAVITADCIKVRPHLDLTSSEFLYWAIRSKILKDQILQETKGVAQQKLSLDRFRQIAIPTPPLEEQHEIVRRIESAFAKIDRMAGQAKRALDLVGRLDEAILAKAFRGELVPQDENDEPAEHLLARIRAEREKAPKERKRTVKRKSTMLTARDFLNAKLPNWPNDGISFQDLRSEFSGSYDDLKDAVFTFLSDKDALLQQVFDEKRSAMTLRKR
ncbi:hypothetical protein HJB86_19595 [Rhizobium sp. NZLR3b]|uniref:restriction endonuclease subunit S n=1 Tax=Rhizobium sp. NZLR3b TaxID=2731101 RepID=UPI001C8300D8|nr:restriction endonuclease subunit S [Rhizobium sp. NZLR3b]MBX5191088.1 hypothetical protein [Rhizobium sp. NZLR3b]